MRSCQIIYGVDSDPAALSILHVAVYVLCNTCVFCANELFVIEL